MWICVYYIQKATNVINGKDLFTCLQVTCLGFFLLGWWLYLFCEMSQAIIKKPEVMEAWTN